MDERTKYILIIVGSVLALLIGIALIIRYLVKKDEEEIESNKRVILFNKRTKQIKEIFNKDYVETKSWEKIVVTPDSMIDQFMVFLRRDNTINKEGLYIGKPAHGAFYLKWKFKHFIDEISEVED